MQSKQACSGEGRNSTERVADTPRDDAGQGGQDASQGGQDASQGGQGNKGNKKRPREGSSYDLNGKKKLRKAPYNNPERTTAHGSYVEYYKRRVDVVSRVRLLERTWVEGCSILDVGCNDGAVALALAKGRIRKSAQAQNAPRSSTVGPTEEGGARVSGAASFSRGAAKNANGTGANGTGGALPAVGRSLHVPRAAAPGPPARVVGIDIDQGLIERARAQLRTSRERGEIRAPVVEFRREDFSALTAGVTAAERGAYDLVTILSVTKWVHLYGGDAAVKRLFARARDCLKPGGVLVLEPQPWSSYSRALLKARKKANAELQGQMNSVTDSHRGSGASGLPVNQSADVARNGSNQHAEPVMGEKSGEAATRASPSRDSTHTQAMAREVEVGPSGLFAKSSLQLRPDGFTQHLLSSEGGFSHMHMLRHISPAKNQPFNRPIMAFFKRGS